jgi:CO dehydrogenase maturation factor
MHATVRSLIEIVPTEQSEVCILDTEASPEHLSRGTARYADTMLVVAEPYFKSLETARRMAVLGRDLGLKRVVLAANKVRDEQELAAVREFADKHQLELAGVIPYDPAFPDAERAGLAPIDSAPDAPATAAVAALAERLVANGR